MCEKFFPQTPTAHLAGQGCPDCGIKRVADALRSTKEEFEEKANKKWGVGRYLYHMVIYINSETLVSIWCTVCEKFFDQRPASHLNYGCKDCGHRETSLKQMRDQDEVIKEAQEVHGSHYEYDQVVYRGMNHDVDIWCTIHKYYFPQTMANHIRNKHGCWYCGYEKLSLMFRKDENVFKKQATIKHNNKYGYDMVEYVNSTTDVLIYCFIHNFLFPQRPDSHLRGSGCPICAKLSMIKKLVIIHEVFISNSIKIHGLLHYNYDQVIIVNSSKPLAPVQAVRNWPNICMSGC